QEILDAANRALASGLKELDETSFSKLLYSPSLPDPDLLIRTSGEMRISNFLLWQTAYSEFYVTDTFWPDFRDKEFSKALVDYQERDRRRGK
ncbi:MAG: isoprenyl transferase, partial [Elusimicrobia bacterium CG_4_10_14_0_2_um_filter_56_8]